MKRARNYLAALFLLVAAVACSSSPTAPNAAPNQNMTPIIGSGIGGG